MRIERYYYSEHKALWESRQKEMKEHLHIQKEATQKLSIEEQRELTLRQKKAIEETFLELLHMPSIVYSAFNPQKYNVFVKLAEISVILAELLRANLLVYTEDMTGCISLVAEEMTYTREQKQLLSMLTLAADEVHVGVSADTGEGSPMDIDGLVRTEFWFDCYASVAEE